MLLTFAFISLNSNFQTIFKKCHLRLSFLFLLFTTHTNGEHTPGDCITSLIRQFQLLRQSQTCFIILVLAVIRVIQEPHHPCPSTHSILMGRPILHTLPSILSSLLLPVSFLPLSLPHNLSASSLTHHILSVVSHKPKVSKIITCALYCRKHPNLPLQPNLVKLWTSSEESCWQSHCLW